MVTDRASALAGGVADKLGNRYEGWWTIWRGVVPVLRGVYDALIVEEVGESGEAVEFRLLGRQPAGSDQVHQCKRSRDSQWTVNALRSERLLEPFGRHMRRGRQVFFASGTSCVLHELSNKARRLSTTEWTETLSKSDKSNVELLSEEWSTDAAGVHSRLQGFFAETISDGPLRNAALEAVQTQVTGDAEQALLFLGDLLLERLSARLTADDLWRALREEGFAPREGYDHALAVTVQEVSGRYVDGVRRRRPANLELIARAEVGQIVSTLAGPVDGPGLVVTGSPGGGKSTVLSEVCARLAAEGFIVGPLRLDVADVSHTARELGVQEAIGFGASPAAVVERAAAGGRAVVVIDQLDALSQLASQSEPVLTGVREMMEAVRASPGIKLLVACRLHDLKNDRQLRDLLGDLERVELSPLSGDQVHEALDGLGVDATRLSEGQRRLFASPFALRLLADVVTKHAEDDPGFDLDTVRTLTQLLAAFDDEMRRRLRQRLGTDNFTRGVAGFARQLSNRGVLSAPRLTVLDPGPDTLDALIREGVLVEEAGRVRFFHEEYFDYAFARQHVGAGGTAQGLLRGDLQDLLRRRQIRAVLGLERELSPHLYRNDLRAVLVRGGGCRSHIRSAALRWLTTFPPHLWEYELVAGIAADEGDPLPPKRGRPSSVPGSSPTSLIMDWRAATLLLIQAPSWRPCSGRTRSSGCLPRRRGCLRRRSARACFRWLGTRMQRCRGLVCCCGQSFCPAPRRRRPPSTCTARPRPRLRTGSPPP